MEFKSACPVCIQVTNVNDLDRIEQIFEDAYIHYTEKTPDNGVFFWACSQGHNVAHGSQQHKFELLSEIAIQAILDGYFRESVASFAACLEQLMAHYVDIICLHKGIKQESYDKTQKAVGSLSERQQGAFALTYLLETSEPPPCLQDKWIKFRNAVIHKGKIPSRVEAIDFAQAVADIAFKIIDCLNVENYRKATNRRARERLDERVRIADQAKREMVAGVWETAFCMNIQYPEGQMRTIQDLLEYRLCKRNSGR